MSATQSPDSSFETGTSSIPGSQLFEPHGNPPLPWGGTRDEAIQLLNPVRVRNASPAHARQAIGILRAAVGQSLLSPEAFLAVVHHAAVFASEEHGKKDRLTCHLRHEARRIVTESGESDDEPQSEPHRTRYAQISARYDERLDALVVETLHKWGEHGLAIFFDCDKQAFDHYRAVGDTEIGRELFGDHTPGQYPALDSVIGIETWRPRDTWAGHMASEWSEPFPEDALPDKHPVAELVRQLFLRWFGGYWEGKTVFGNLSEENEENEPLLVFLWFADTGLFAEFFVFDVGFTGNLDVICHSRELDRNPLEDFRASLCEMYGALPAQVETYVRIRGHKLRGELSWQVNVV